MDGVRISVKIQTNLVRRGAVYYFRARLPADLVSHYGKREILASLKTKDKQEATCKVRTERVRLDQAFAHARALLASCSAVAPASVVIDQTALHSATKATNQPANLPVIRRLTPHASADDSLQAIFTYWKTQGQKRPRTIQEAETVVNRLNERTQGKPASEITKSDIVSFKDTLLAERKAYATVTKQLNLLKAIFQTAADNDKLVSNPATGVKVPQQKTATKSRIPFSTHDLRTIFKSDIYTLGDRPKAGAGEAAYWIPLLALWTGARLEEIGQLLIADIQEESGIQYLHITNDGGDKNVKTTSSRRKVPIHSELVRYGFMEYVESVKLASHRLQFVSLL